ncbi:MAG: YvcK family protein [Candidatus Omnitrophica bacterium]|nr:YvcK family protein [Candidatus Omnitrophota bacterium]
MQPLKWLFPGMLVKRWLFLGIIGIIMISMGFAIIISEDIPASKTGASVVIIFGIILVITSIKRMIKSLLMVIMPQQKQKDLVDMVYKKRQLDRSFNIVALGGGTGLSTLLHGLKEYTSNITAIVTVADDGGSSGRLREEFGMLPPGDIRNCLVALADAEPLMGKLFQFRFTEGEGLKDHNFGNLFITAMLKVTGDFEKAVKESSKVLAIRGSVIPSTLSRVTLMAEYQDGTRTIGESKISHVAAPIKRLHIKPTDCKATREAIEAIRKAEMILLGPGSLYTSIMPNIIIPEISRELAQSKAMKVYICNVMTQHGETDGYKAGDHLKAILAHTTPDVVTHCIVNSGGVPEALQEKYKEEDAYPVIADVEAIERMGYKVIRANVISTKDYVRHDAVKLAKIINDFAPARKAQQ